jgi:hypothetical protein
MSIKCGADLYWGLIFLLDSLFWEDEGVFYGKRLGAGAYNQKHWVAMGGAEWIGTK